MQHALPSQRCSLLNLKIEISPNTLHRMHKNHVANNLYDDDNSKRKGKLCHNMPREEEINWFTKVGVTIMIKKLVGYTLRINSSN